MATQAIFCARVFGDEAGNPMVTIPSQFYPDQWKRRHPFWRRAESEPLRRTYAEPPSPVISQESLPIYGQPSWLTVPSARCPELAQTGSVPTDIVAISILRCLRRAESEPPRRTYAEPPSPAISRKPLPSYGQFSWLTVSPARCLELAQYGVGAHTRPILRKITTFEGHPAG